MEEPTKRADALSGRLESVAAHPLAELLDCPPETGKLLNDAAECIGFEAGDVVFRQHGACKGLYVVVSGLFFARPSGSRRASCWVQRGSATWWNWRPRWGTGTTPIP